MLKKQLSVNISPDKTYPIFIDSDPIEELGKKVSDYTKGKVLIVINDKVNKLYGKKLIFNNSIKYVLRDGESQKNFKNYKKILDFALKNKLERQDSIVAIGGGVVGDIAGFVAATYLRGIDYIQIPTTLLSCVDSSVGGKVAINTAFGKNLVGAFYQPKAVFCNLNFIKTLDNRQFKTGLAEVLKYGFICKSCIADSTFYDYLVENSDYILERNEENLAEIIEISLKLKAAVVNQDEKEQGLRKILNFGHTYGHAVEKITGYKKYTHGEAVVLGMIYAFDLALKNGLISSGYYNESISLINKYSILKKTPTLNKTKISEAMKSDKKVKDGKIQFILPSSKAYCIISEQIN